MVGTAKWWGWGTPEERYPERRLARVLDLLTARGMPPHAPRDAPEPPHLPASRLGSKALGTLQRIGEVTLDEKERLAHSLGQSYLDLLAARHGGPEEVTDAVAYPGSAEEVRRLIEAAPTLGYAVVPFGGGTSVLGGVRPLRGGHRSVLTVDLVNLDRVLHVDEIARLARVEAGIRGPALEDHLRAHELLLGMYPQSFHFSSVGGWIATSASGHLSGGYGRMADLVQAVRVATPQGSLETRTVPARAVGPSVKDIVLGSEGILGIIVEATLRVRPLPTTRARTALLVPDFSQALEGCRRLLHHGVRPTLLRVSDEAETEMMAALAGMEGEDHPSLVLLGLEGGDAEDRLRRATEAWTPEGGADLGEAGVAAWEAEYYAAPYLRDELIDRGYLVDTLETAASWSALHSLYAATRQAIREVFNGWGLDALLLCHLSHAYPDGGSLYFTLLAPQLPGRERAQWWEVKRAATEAILEHGGTLSHHHGIGVDHRQWMEAEHGKASLTALQGLKRALDPQGIMNPGKVLEEPG